MPHPNPIIAEDVTAILEAVQPVLGRLSNRHILITGAGGFLCSYFVDVLAQANQTHLAQPCRILAMDNFKTGLPQRLAHLVDQPNFELIQQDVSAPFDLPYKMDYIIHGASIASPMIYRQYPLETIDANVNGTRHILDLAHQHRAEGVLYLSSSEIYGDPPPEHIPTSESYWGHVSSVGVRACYDESKRLAETLCMTYARLYDMPVNIVRPFNVYGPGQRLDDQRIIPDLLRAVLEERPITLHSDGRPTRAFCYISDAISGMLNVLLSDQRGEVFNIGNDQAETSIRDLAALVQSLVSKPWLTIHHQTSPDPHYLSDNPQRRCPNVDKMWAFFGWEPRTDLREGLERTLAAYRHDASA